MIYFVFTQTRRLKLKVTTPQFMWVCSLYTISWDGVYLHLFCKQLFGKNINS